MDSEEMERMTLRLPVSLRIELKVMAARNRRSLTSQIISILEKAVAATGEKFGDQAPAAASSNNAALAGGASINR